MTNTILPNPETLPDPPVPQPEPPPRSKWRALWKRIGEWRPSLRAQICLGVLAVMVLAMCIVTGVFYVKLARSADEKLRAGVFSGTFDLYAAPRAVSLGEKLTRNDLVTWLHNNGFSSSSGSKIGWYEVRPDSVAIYTADSPASEPAVISFSGSQISHIRYAGGDRREYEFSPQLITNLSQGSREKRRLVSFAEIPPSLVNAVVAAEDKRFFSHSGFDLLRICKAAYVDLKDGRKEQGASTLSMQLARGIFLEPDKKWKRKLTEFLLTVHLEHKLTKQQIFADYANQVYLGRRGTFSIHGFGEAARAYFDKDISELSLTQAALLAGMVQRPSYYNPFRYPDRAVERRNIVLRLMLDDGQITGAEYANAVNTPLKLSPGGSDSVDSQYFLDLANDQLQNTLDDRESEGEAVYTTLDEDLQRAAVEAVKIGMARVDAQLRSRRHGAIPAGQPQVALIALDPHTGEIKALVGGRDYGSSQLNHATAERQPGSSFKPFVYAAALNSAIAGGQLFTPASTIVDEPTTFQWGNKPYSPGNFEQNFMGTVTLRTALAHSLNVATVSLAQAVGYGAVVNMARRAGLNDNIQPTPAVALGSYVCTPLEIAGAYTVFANNGMYVKPTLLSSVRSRQGEVLYQHSPEMHAALDPRVNYLMVSLLQEVLRSGTGASVWSYGFKAPAAGKTGTSRDGWFAGFTSRLLCIVWVGFDDYRELGLEGSRSALPIWAEFMKRAQQFNSYRDVQDFPVPAGVTSVRLCSESHQLAGPECPSTYTEYFIDGTQPAVQCRIHTATAPSDPGATAAIPPPQPPIDHDQIDHDQIDHDQIDHDQ